MAFAYILKEPKKAIRRKQTPMCATMFTPIKKFTKTTSPNVQLYYKASETAQGTINNIPYTSSYLLHKSSPYIQQNPKFFSPSTDKPSLNNNICQFYIGNNTLVVQAKGSRNDYMGDTPGRDSRTGRAVRDRMINCKEHWFGTSVSSYNGYGGEYVTYDKKDYIFSDDADSSGNYPISLSQSDVGKHVHMGHLYDAVTFWNRIGKYTGSKSSCVRDFMTDSYNYRYENAHKNMSKGAQSGETYDDPVPPYINLSYIGRSNVVDTGNFNQMEALIYTPPRPTLPLTWCLYPFNFPTFPPH